MCLCTLHSAASTIYRSLCVCVCVIVKSICQLLCGFVRGVCVCRASASVSAQTHSVCGRAAITSSRLLSAVQRRPAKRSKVELQQGSGGSLLGAELWEKFFICHNYILHFSVVY